MGVLYDDINATKLSYLLMMKNSKFVLYFPEFFHSSKIQEHAAECGTEVPTEVQSPVREVLPFFPILIA